MTVTPPTKPGLAARKIAAFEKRFGSAHLDLACHAAFPIALTPDLLYRLRLNFHQDSHGQPLNIPWIAISDLLLSTLCSEVGYELYQMDIAVRDRLLERLQQDTRLGQRRIHLLSDFLLDYVQPELQHTDLDVQALANVQRWVALAYTRPHKTAYEVASFLSKLDLDNQAELLRLEVLLQTLAVPLENFQPLLSYVQGLAAFARGHISEATQLLQPLWDRNRQIRVLGVKLPVPNSVQERLDDVQSYPNYRHANLAGQSFTNQDLSHADFSHADIRGANFANANLTGANFSGATMGLRWPWTIALICCAVLLSIAAGFGAMFAGIFLQTAFTNPPAEEIFSLGFISLILSVMIGVAIVRWGIEATLGAFAFVLVGILYLMVVASELTDTIGFITGWDWVTRGVLAIAGTMAFTIGISSSRSGVLGFAGKWANLWVGVIGFGMVVYSEQSLQYLLERYTPYVLTGTTNSLIQTWFENTFNPNADEAIYYTTLVIVTGVVGIVLLEAVSIALVQPVNTLLAIAIGYIWIPIWLGRFGLGESWPRLGGAITTAIAIIGLGMYVGWQALAGDRRYGFANQAVVAFTSKWLRGTRFQDANLMDANFAGATVSYANFSNTTLTRVSWFQAKALDLAHFAENPLKSKPVQDLATTGRGQGMVLDRLSLPGIDLAGADLARASLIDTDLREANLQDADLSGAKLCHTQLDRADLTGACLTGAVIQCWQITAATKLDGVECDYFYTRLPTPDNPDPGRQPEDNQRVFEPGDFADFIQPSEQRT